MKKVIKIIFLTLALLAGQAVAATCTSKASGNWNSSGTWNCTSGSTPASGDTVILASPYTVSLNNNNRTVASLTINVGATLNDDGQDLTVTGSVAINGTYDGSGNNGNLIMTGNGQTLSGTGTVKDIKRIQIDANITIPAGSNLNLTLQSEIRVGDNAAATLTVNGTITGTAQTNGNRLIRVDNNNASNVIINGTINAPSSFVEVQAGGTVTNNGTVTLQYLDGNGDATADWTQGANSTLTLSQPAQGWNGTFDASATGNTVNFNGTATPFNPATYFNINVPAGQCPHPAGITVTGTSSCGAGGGGGTACIPTTVAGVPSPFIAGAGGLQLGNNGTVNGTPIVVSGTTSLPVTGTTSASNAGTLPALTPATFPAVGTGTLNTTGPVAAGSYGTINASGSPTVFSGGTYYIEKLKATGPIQLAAGTYYINKLDLSANLTVTGAVQLFIGDQIDLKNNGISLNAGGNAGNLQVNLYGGAEFDAGKNNISFTGLIYSPFTSSQVQFDNNATITGAIITAGQIQFGNNATVNYNATVQGQISSLACPVSVPDHYELSLPTSGITCLPITATVTACADNSSPCTNNYTAVSGKTATLATSGGTLGTTTVTFDATGVATTTLSYPAAADGTAVSVTLSGEQTAATNLRQCCPDGVSCAVANSCSTTLNTAGFIFSASPNGAVATIPTQMAGTSSGTFYLRAVKTNTATMACQSALTGAQSVNFAYECNNPAACYAANLMSVNGGTTTTIARNNNGSVASYLSANMTFDANGNAPFTFNYGDVGQVTLHVSKASGGTLLSPLTGSSNAFVVKPAGFVLSGIQQTAAPNLVNPAAVNATGVKFVKAGEAFSVTVTAKTSTGSTAYNYGQETVPEGARLTSALVTGLGLTDNPVIGGTFGAFTNGVATGSAFTWNEVGIITLTPNVADADYLGTGDTTGTTSGNVGRFYAAQFALTGGTIANRTDIAACAASGCGSFTYMGEKMNAVFTLTAKATDGTTTLQNYATANNFAKLNLATASDSTPNNTLGFGAVDTVSPTYLSARLDTSLSPGGSFNIGVADVVAPIAFARSASPDGPYALLNIGVAPVDSDGVAATPFNLGTTNVATLDHVTLGITAVRFGRLAISDTSTTSSALDLHLPMLTQYWNGSAFVTNADDQETTLSASNFHFKASSETGYMHLSGAAQNMDDTHISLTGSILNGAFKNGVLDGLVVTKPSPTIGGRGSAIVEVDLSATGENKPYLLGKGTNYSLSPSATVTFGSNNNNYKSKFIDLRENY